MATCEDYPCCGHTDGLGCDWVYTDSARKYDIDHAMCDHEAGFCDHEDLWSVDPEDEDSDDWDGMEDQWLDGSYEE